MTEKYITHSRSKPYNPDMTDRARKMRQEMTAAERKLWFCFLKYCPYKVYRQRPIMHYIVDFYCPAKKLVIEVDGSTHFHDDAEIYDNERTKCLKTMGLRVIRFTNKEIAENFEAVCKAIEVQ